jgi:hypothetical protein
LPGRQEATQLSPSCHKRIILSTSACLPWQTGTESARDIIILTALLAQQLPNDRGSDQAPRRLSTCDVFLSALWCCALHQ